MLFRVYEAVTVEAVETYGGATRYAVEAAGALNADRELRRIADQFFAKGVDGIILSNPPPGLDLGDLDPERFSMIAVGRADRELPLAAVRPDVGAAVRICFDKLREAGCRRIGAALHRHQPLYLDDRDRVASWLETRRRNGTDRAADSIFESPMADFAGLDEWLREEMIDGLIAFTAGDYHTLRSRGWDIPGALRIAVLTGMGAEAPDYAFIDERIELMHQLAMDQLDFMMRLRQRGLQANPFHFVLPPIWQAGPTL